MKKSLILALALTVALSFSLTGCGDKKADSVSSDDPVKEELSVDTEDTQLSADPETDTDKDADENDKDDKDATAAAGTAQQDKKDDGKQQAAAQKPQQSGTSANQGTSAKPSKPSGNDGQTSAKTPSKATAQSYIGKSASSMIAAMGAPNSSQYSSSCMGDGEDGELYYNGFTVYTYRENGQEKVVDVE